MPVSVAKLKRDPAPTEADVAAADARVAELSNEADVTQTDNITSHAPAAGPIRAGGMFGSDTLAAIDSLEINSVPPRSLTNRTDVTQHGVFSPTEIDPLVWVPTRDPSAGPFDDAAIRSALENN
jgi:hypothetical protein